MKKICVLFGGQSAEHDISIITGMQLANKIRDRKDIEIIYLGLDNCFYLATKIKNLDEFLDKKTLKLKKVTFFNGGICRIGKIVKKICEVECVINCCHGGAGENGDLAGFFELNRIRYTSAQTLPSAIAMNKSCAKMLVSGLARTLEGVNVTQDNYTDMVQYIDENMSNELIVKPNSLGSSIGVKVCDKSNYREQINAIFLMNDSALVERRVVNLVEYNQACIKTKEGLILSAIESPTLKSQILSFDDKYKGAKGKGKDREIPAKIGRELEEKINNMTRKIYQSLGMNGVVRIDYIYDKDTGEIYFNEINTIPGSMAFYLFEPVGVDYISLVEMLIDNAEETKRFKYYDTNVLDGKKV